MGCPKFRPRRANSINSPPTPPAAIIPRPSAQEKNASETAHKHAAGQKRFLTPFPPVVQKRTDSLSVEQKTYLPALRAVLELLGRPTAVLGQRLFETRLQAVSGRRQHCRPAGALREGNVP